MTDQTDRYVPSFDSSPELHAKLNEALPLWSELTEVEPEATSWSNMHNLNISRTFEDLQKAQEWDNSGLTTAMILQHLLEWYPTTISFKLDQIIAGNHEKTVQHWKQLRELTNAPEVSEAIDRFIINVKRAARLSGIENFESHMEDHNLITGLRRSSIKAIQTLSSFQFTSGEKDEHFKDNLIISQNIYRFYSIHTFITELMKFKSKSVVILALISDQKKTSSYFAFGIKNRENIYILTDRHEYDHPHQQFMTRRSGRIFEDRVNSYFFPYDLIKKEEAEQKGLAIGKPDIIRIGDITELEKDEALWFVMMSDLIAKRFFVDDPKAQRAYTAAMVDIPQLTDPAEHKKLPMVIRDNAPQIKIGTIEEIADTDAITKSGQWEREPIKHNEWLLQRHLPDVIKENRSSKSSILFRH